MRKGIPKDCAGPCVLVWNQAMRLKQVAKVDRLSSLQDENNKGRHLVEDKALGGGWAMEDFTGEELKLPFVRRVRQEEIACIHNKNVCTVMKRDEAKRRRWKILRIRWMDINKRDLERPVCRSRFEAKECNDSVADGLFTPTTRRHGQGRPRG